MASRVSLIQSRSIYVGTANNVAPSDGNLIVTGNVGIGTTSPGFPLHVIGKIYANPYHPVAISGGGNPYYGSNITMASDIGSTAGAVRIWSRYDGSGYAATSFERATDSQAYNQDPQLLTYAESMRISGTGNVGIGTTAPGYKLDVFGASNTDAFVRVIGGAGATKGGYVFGNNDGTKDYGKIYFDNSNNNIYFFQYYNAGDIIFGANSTERMRMTNAGNFGIGTTSPAQKLTVAGDGSFTDTLSINKGASDTVQQGSSLYLIGGSGASYTQLQQGVGRFIIFGFTGSSWVERFTINNTTGNVGIGTTAPGAKLQVNGTIATNSSLSDVDAYRIIKPNGGAFSTSTPSLTGAIRITYPVGFTNTMHRVKVNIYEYTTNESFTIYFGGYNYSPDSLWYNEFAYVVNNPGTDRNFTVRFGYNGTKMVVYIGELASTWAYPQVFIEEVELGYGGQSSAWRDDAWAIGFEATAFQNVSKTVSNPQATNWARNGSSTYYSLGNVGIGTTAPTQKLEVVGSAAGDFPGIALTNTNTGGSSDAVTAIFRLTRSDGTTYSAPAIRFVKEQAWTTTASTIDAALTFSTTLNEGTTERMRITSDGNVGIGTTAPVHKLEVDGAANSIVASFDHTSFDGRQVGLPGRFMVGPLGSGYPEIGYNFTTSSSVYTKLVNDTAWGMTFGVSNRMSFRYAGAGTGTFSWSEFMSITNAGNVGIGTTNPTEKLDVAGNGKLQGNLYLTATDPYIEGSGSGAMRIKHTAGQVMYIRPDQAGNVVFFEGASGQAVYMATATPSVNSTQNSSSTLIFEARARNAGGTLNIKSTSLQNTVYDIANNLSRFSITGQDVLYLEGNVGIGTNNPAQKLHVSGNGLYTGNLDVGHGVSTADAAINLGTGRTGNGFAYIDLIGDTTYTDYGLRILRNNGGANTTSLIVHRGTGDFSIQNNEAANLVFLTAASERMRISSTGNVGIGTTSPSTRLEVLGDTEVITIRTTYPANLSQRGALLWKDATNITGAIDTRYDGTTVDMYFGSLYSSGYNSTTRMVIKGNGNVGIGTTSPTEKLHVDGNVVVTYNNSYQGINSVGNKAILARVSPTSGIINYAEYATAANLNGFVIGSTDARVKGNIATDSLEFITNVSERMRITSAGNVGIGTSSPSNILHITNVMRMDNVSAYSPNLSLTSTPKYGYGDVSNDRYLAEPVVWLKINVDGTEYVIPGYTEVI